MRLIDADRLKEKVLKWLPSDPCGIEEKEHPIETDIVISLMMEIEEAPTVNKWIPVSEKLPDKEELVLVTDNDSIEFGKLICGLFGDLWLIWVDDCWTEAMKVTAWMPLPEPYKGETNGKM